MDLLLDSLRRRMRAMHALYEDALATMPGNQWWSSSGRPTTAQARSALTPITRSRRTDARIRPPGQGRGADGGR